MDRPFGSTSTMSAKLVCHSQDPAPLRKINVPRHCTLISNIIRHHGWPLPVQTSCQRVYEERSVVEEVCGGRSERRCLHFSACIDVYFFCVWLTAALTADIAGDYLLIWWIISLYGITFLRVSLTCLSPFELAANIVTVDEGLSGFSNEGVLTVLVSLCHSLSVKISIPLYFVFCLWSPKKANVWIFVVAHN